MTSFRRRICNLVTSAFVLCSCQVALASPVTYTFDFAITSDFYADDLTGDLFKAGTTGTGTATFFYQPASVVDPASDVYATYKDAPFDVQISYNGISLKLIDSTVIGQYNRRGIVVQDMDSSSPMYDTLAIEGFSGPVYIPDSTGNPVIRILHTQLGLFSTPNAMNSYDLNEANVMGIANNLATTSFNIKSAEYFGQVNGSISNFRLETVSAVPEPETYAMMLAGLGLMGFVARRHNGNTQC